MAVDKLVDSTKLDASLTYEAGKIRAKLGSSSQVVFDFENEKGFGDAIEAIPTGGVEPVYGLLTTINITEPVALIEYPLSSVALSEGKIWLDCVGLQFSASDYFYAQVRDANTTPNDPSGFTPRTTSFTGKIMCMFGVDKTISGTTFNGYSGSTYSLTSSTSSRTAFISNFSPATLKCKLYQSTSTITGGTIYVYGRLS